jgi:hypothetical protein
MIPLHSSLRVGPEPPTGGRGAIPRLPVLVRLSSERARQPVRRDCSFGGRHKPRAVVIRVALGEGVLHDRLVALQLSFSIRRRTSPRAADTADAAVEVLDRVDYEPPE